jgi:hypothetical protein
MGGEMWEPSHSTLEAKGFAVLADALTHGLRGWTNLLAIVAEQILVLAN